MDLFILVHRESPTSPSVDRQIDKGASRQNSVVQFGRPLILSIFRLGFSCDDARASAYLELAVLDIHAAVAVSFGLAAADELSIQSSEEL